jgi:hypothetical protein
MVGVSEEPIKDIAAEYYIRAKFSFTPLFFRYALEVFESHYDHIRFH